MTFDCKTRIVAFVVLVMVLSMASGVSAGEAWDQFTISRADVHFAIDRCTELTGENSIETMADHWARQVFPNNKKTHCFVKCILGKLGLISLLRRGLDSPQITLALTNCRVELTYRCMWFLSNLEDNGDDRCQVYYDLWNRFNRNCPKIITEMTTNCALPQKRLSMSAIELCDDIIQTHREKHSEWDAQTEDTSKANGGVMKKFHEIKPERNSSTSDSCTIACVFKHLHYFDAYGRLDETEILLSVAAATEGSPELAQLTEGCVRRANQRFSMGSCDMAQTLWLCLDSKRQPKTTAAGGDGGVQFRRVIMHRNEVSRLY